MRHPLRTDVNRATRHALTRRQLLDGAASALAGVVLCRAGRTEGLMAAEEELWIRPRKPGDPPLWGFREGLRVGLPPLPGPRGLLRLYHTGLGQPPETMINFIAIEPVTAQGRCYSELETSALDRVQGMRLWAADTFSDEPPPARPAHETPGRVITPGGRRALELFLYVEPFALGPQPVLRLRFHEGAPDEVELASFAAKGSAPMRQCILTATMGNYARLRQLHLRERVVQARELWPDYREAEFAPAVDFPAPELRRLHNGDFLVEATPDEADPRGAEYAPHTAPFWRYVGKSATQYWRRPNVEPKPRRLHCRVNGRFCYWRSHSPLPGGIGFENFELEEEFAPGVVQVFGVRPIA